MSADLVVVFEIKEYMIIFRQVERREFGGIETLIRGILRCSGFKKDSTDTYRLDVYFLDTNSAFPMPQIDLANRTGSMFMPYDFMVTLVDVLRNEKPIFAHLRADRPEWTSITTTNEPVGTGDEDF